METGNIRDYTSTVKNNAIAKKIFKVDIYYNSLKHLKRGEGNYCVLVSAFPEKSLAGKQKIMIYMN